MSGDVSSVAESRSHLFNRERIFVGDGLHRLPGGDRSDKRCDIDPGSAEGMPGAAPAPDPAGPDTADGRPASVPGGP